MHRLKIRGNILFGYLFTFIFSIIFIGAATVIFKNIYAVVLTAAVIFLLVFYVGKKYGKVMRLAPEEQSPRSIFSITEKQVNRFFIISVTAMFILQLTAGYFLKSTPVTDWMTIDIIAKNFAKSGNFENMYASLPASRYEYIARYTNNNGILVLLSLYYRIVYLIFGKVPSFAPIFLNAVFINTAVTFTFFISKKLFKPFGSFLTVVICLLFLPYYTYTPYYYSDSLSLPFTVISVFLVLSGARIKTDTKDRKRLVKKIVYLITAGFFIAVGYELKGSIIIVTVGALVYIILENRLKGALIGALSVTLSTLICISAINLYNDSLHFTTKEQLYEQQYPAIHWVMMGLKGNGGFDQADATATRNSGNYDQKTEAIKKEIGCAAPLVTEEIREIRGRDAYTGLPIAKDISSSELEYAMKDSIDEIIDCIRQTLEQTPPELISDIAVKGVMIAGGGALIKNIDKYFEERLAIPVYVAQNPLDCVAIGTQKMLEDMETLKRIAKSKA